MPTIPIEKAPCPWCEDACDLEVDVIVKAPGPFQWPQEAIDHEKPVLSGEKIRLVVVKGAELLCTKCGRSFHHVEDTTESEGNLQVRQQLPPHSASSPGNVVGEIRDLLNRAGRA